MLVYDFKNVAKIKNLKNSESITPIHAERIAEIPTSIVKDFDYEKYKSNPPHKNESMMSLLLKWIILVNHSKTYVKS